MSLFPPTVPVAVFVDGRPLAAYASAYAVGGRVFAPVAPLLTRLADRIWFDGDVLVIERDGRRVRLFLAPRAPDALDHTYVAIGPVLRGLGEPLRYDGVRHRLDVHAQRGELSTATAAPGNAAPVPQRAVFTPEPPVTPRPVWTGSPVPRRTPLPATDLPLGPGRAGGRSG